MSYVQIDKLSKTYDQTAVLRDISFAVEEGQFLTLLGPSGCGKSTLLRAIAGLAEIDAGQIVVGGRDITGLSPKSRNVGLVFQVYALFPNMTVYENIAFGLKMDKMKKHVYAPLVEDMIRMVDLVGKENRYPSQLSGGQQQRVALARSLVKRPGILLLDEPLSALDAQIRRNLRSEIRQLQKRLGLTTVFVTHDQEEALTVSDRIIVMNQGSIEQEGTPEDIYTRPATEFVARFIGSYNVWRKEQLGGAGIGPLPAGEVFAVLPEAISLYPAAASSGSSEQAAALEVEEAGWKSSSNRGENSLRVSGRVKQSAILGNIRRFTVDVHGLEVLVDVLHDAAAYRIIEQMEVQVVIPLEHCRIFHNAS